MKTALHITLLFFGLFLLSQCESGKEVETSAGKLLAEVGNKKLFISELEGMIPANASQEDSSLIINALIERWAREAVLLNEAEMNVPNDLNINKLVRDYRSSLVKGNYESILIEQHLDSLVTEEELVNFYENSKAQFSLEQPILRCRFLKIAKTDAGLENLKSRWKKYSEEENPAYIEEYAKQHAVFYKLKDAEWYDLSEIALALPEGKLTSSNVGGKKTMEFSDESYQYLYHPLEVIKSDNEPPFDYVKSKIKRVILHRRKQALLDAKKEEIYNRELQRNAVKVY